MQQALNATYSELSNTQCPISLNSLEEMKVPVLASDTFIYEFESLAEYLLNLKNNAGLGISRIKIQEIILFRTAFKASLTHQEKRSVAHYILLLVTRHQGIKIVGIPDLSGIAELINVNSADNTIESLRTLETSLVTDQIEAEARLATILQSMSIGTQQDTSQDIEMGLTSSVSALGAMTYSLQHRPTGAELQQEIIKLKADLDNIHIFLRRVRARIRERTPVPVPNELTAQIQIITEQNEIIPNPPVIRDIWSCEFANLLIIGGYGMAVTALASKIGVSILFKTNRPNDHHLAVIRSNTAGAALLSTVMLACIWYCKGQTWKTGMHQFFREKTHMLNQKKWNHRLLIIAPMTAAYIVFEIVSAVVGALLCGLKNASIADCTMATTIGAGIAAGVGAIATDRFMADYARSR